MIGTYHPKATVNLTKNVSFDRGAAERYKGMRSTIDLTKWLGENGEVTTHKTIDAKNPIGSFTITLADRMDAETQDSIYALAAPMDLMEIRMARDSYKYNGDYPIVIRGFVTNVRRTETMGNDGKPTRAVVITGMDYAKIFYNIQILLFSYVATGAFKGGNGFNFSLLFGQNKKVVPVKEFFEIIIIELVVPYLSSMFSGKGVIADIGTDFLVDEGKVLLDGINPDHHSTWNLMLEQADTAWNELFIEESEFSSVLVHRKKPYKDPYSGKYILSGTSAKETEIDDTDIMSLDVSRSDSNVANHIKVDSKYMFLTSNLKNHQFAVQTDPKSVYFQDYPNSDPVLYGDRLMNEETNLSGAIAATHGLPEAEQREAENDIFEWIRKRRLELFDLNKDNVVLEEGRMTIKGNELIRPGMYLKVNRGNLQAEYYIKEVTQKYLPFRNFTTDVEFIRGTGFVERTRSGKGVYLSEIGKSVYS